MKPNQLRVTEREYRIIAARAHILKGQLSARWLSAEESANWNRIIV